LTSEGLLNYLQTSQTESNEFQLQPVKTVSVC